MSPDHPVWFFRGYTCLLCWSPDQRLALVDIDHEEGATALPIVVHLDVTLSEPEQLRLLGRRLRNDEVVLDTSIGQSANSWIDDRVTVLTNEWVNLNGRRLPIIRVLPSVCTAHEFMPALRTAGTLHRN